MSGGVSDEIMDHPRSDHDRKEPTRTVGTRGIVGEGDQSVVFIGAGSKFVE